MRERTVRQCFSFVRHNREEVMPSEEEDRELKAASPLLLFKRCRWIALGVAVAGTLPGVACTLAAGAGGDCGSKDCLMGVPRPTGAENDEDDEDEKTSSAEAACSDAAAAASTAASATVTS